MTKVNDEFRMTNDEPAGAEVDGQAGDEYRVSPRNDYFFMLENQSPVPFDKLRVRWVEWMGKDFGGGGRFTVIDFVRPYQEASTVLLNPPPPKSFLNSERNHGP